MASINEAQNRNYFRNLKLVALTWNFENLGAQEKASDKPAVQD